MVDGLDVVAVSIKDERRGVTRMKGPLSGWSVVALHIRWTVGLRILSAAFRFCVLDDALLDQLMAGDWVATLCRTL